MKIKANIVLLLLLCIFLGTAIVGCIEQNNSVIEQTEESEEYQVKYLKRLKRIGAILNMDVMEEEFLEDTWVKNRTILPDTDVTVSLYILDHKIYAYKMITGTELALTAEDIVSLYQTPNEQKQIEFDQFYDWYLNNSSRYSIYNNGIMAANYLYKKQYGYKYKNKDFFCLTAEECAQLAKWAIENPDYTYAQENSDGARWYAEFLDLMGLSSETEQQGGSDESNIAT